MSSTDLSPGSQTLDRLGELEQRASVEDDNGTNLSHLTNAELREDILAMVNVESLSTIQDKDDDYSRKFYKSEKVGIIMFLLEQYGVEENPIASFCNEALQWQLEHINGAQRNALLGQLIGVPIDEAGTGNNASRLRRDELKRLYHKLESF